jgi:hypothetical protein
MKKITPIWNEYRCGNKKFLKTINQTKAEASLLYAAV